ncbi:histidine kinase [Rubritalea marina]|uniref:histidine kinase n=1 Tax=Rubritalea marina TaxID=361055 RepID=UPI000372B46C|nr:histidine kinase [Rubritalea marina]
MPTCVRQIFYLSIFLLSLCSAEATRREISEKVEASSLHELEQRLVEVKQELDSLARYSFRNGVGAVGYRTIAHQSSDNTEWVQIDMGKLEQVDEVVLVPSIWRDTKEGFVADAFPEEFQIIVGNGPDDEGTVVASFDADDQLLPRIAPVVIPCGSVEGTWVRVEATKLSRRAWDGMYILQLFEVLIFNGERNVAIQRPIEVSSPNADDGDLARDKRFLVDGFLPYLMDAAHGEQSLAFNSRIGIGKEPVITMDLGEDILLDRINIHSLDLSDTVPQVITNDFGMPRWLVVEGSNDPDFKTFDRLTEYQMTSLYESGPIIMRDFEPQVCRYIRVVALEPYARMWRGLMKTQIGFAEIEVFSGAENVALGKKLYADFPVDSPVRSISALTDGRNLYGDILPLRLWMQELSRRHELEVEKPLIEAELELRYARQTKILNRTGWLAVLLGAGIIVTILIERLNRVRQVTQIRERLAADLHDELGANIHTIGLLSDLASETEDDPEELSTLHRRIRSETERSRAAVRYCINMLEADELYTDLKDDMERAARRIMAKLDYTLKVEGEQYLRTLPGSVRFDLFLFYKECLVNISRHSGATTFDSVLVADEKRVVLTVTDNGIGSDRGEDYIPHSLQRRAKLLKATVSSENPESGGTRIILKLPTRRRRIFS